MMWLRQPIKIGLASAIIAYLCPLNLPQAHAKISACDVYLNSVLNDSAGGAEGAAQAFVRLVKYYLDQPVDKQNKTELLKKITETDQFINPFHGSSYGSLGLQLERAVETIQSRSSKVSQQWRQIQKSVAELAQSHKIETEDRDEKAGQTSFVFDPEYLGSISVDAVVGHIVDKGRDLFITRKVADDHNNTTTYIRIEEFKKNQFHMISEFPITEPYYGVSFHQSQDGKSHLAVLQKDAVELFEMRNDHFEFRNSIAQNGDIHHITNWYDLSDGRTFVETKNHGSSSWVFFEVGKNGELVSVNHNTVDAKWPAWRGDVSRGSLSWQPISYNGSLFIVGIVGHGDDLSFNVQKLSDNEPTEFRPAELSELPIDIASLMSKWHHSKDGGAYLAKYHYRSGDNSMTLVLNSIRGNSLEFQTVRPIPTFGEPSFRWFTSSEGNEYLIVEIDQEFQLYELVDGSLKFLKSRTGSSSRGQSHVATHMSPHGQNFMTFIVSHHEIEFYTLFNGFLTENGKVSIPDINFAAFMYSPFIFSAVDGATYELIFTSHGSKLISLTQKLIRSDGAPGGAR